MSNKNSAAREKIVNRLKCAEGHIKRILAMLEDDKKSCLEIALQIKAVEKALSKTKQVFIHAYIDHCLKQLGKNGSSELYEFFEITKHL